MFHEQCEKVIFGFLLGRVYIYITRSFDADNHQPHHGLGGHQGLHGQDSRESRDSSNITIVVHPVAKEVKKSNKGENPIK